MPANIMISNSLLIQVAQFDVLSNEGICSQCDIYQYFEFDKVRDA